MQHLAMTSHCTGQYAFHYHSKSNTQADIKACVIVNVLLIIHMDMLCSFTGAHIGKTKVQD